MIKNMEFQNWHCITVNKMDMKRVFYSLLLLSFVFLLIFPFIGCTKKNETADSSSEPQLQEDVAETKTEQVVFNDEECCEPEIDTLGLMGVWAWESLKLTEKEEQYSWGKGFASDYDSFTIDKRDGKLYVYIVGFGEYNITELSEDDGIIKLSFYFPQATKTEIFYIRMLSEYELIFVDADENNTTQFFRADNETRFFRLDGPPDVSILKTPYMARVNADADVTWFDKAVHVEEGSLVQIVRFDRTEPIAADNYNKTFHVLIDEDNGGYIEGKYLDILSDQVIY